MLDKDRKYADLEGRTEDEVYTGKLLQRLEQTSSQETLAKRSLEAVGICRLAQRHLIKMVCLDFAQFLHDSWVVNWQATKLAKTAGSLLILVHLDEISWCLGQEEESSDKSASTVA
jgi:hypothetical protein